MTGLLEGRVAFITGAARGQGRNHAVRLAGEGVDIIAVDICRPVNTVPADLASPDDLQETAKLVESQGRRIVASQVDVRDFAGLKAAVDSGVERLGRLDIVLANAGIGTGGARVQDIDEAEWEAMIDINLTGVWKTVKAAVPHIISGGNGGSVVLTSSAAGLKAYPMMAQYVAAKHGVVGLMRTLALELAPQLIRVNSVQPTHVATPMVMNDSTYAMFRPDLPEPGLEDIVAICQKFHPMPRPWIESDDVTNAVLFLVSDAARYITGVPLPIDLGSGLK